MPQLKHWVNSGYYRGPAAQLLRGSPEPIGGRNMSPPQVVPTFTFRCSLGYEVHTGVPVADYNGHEGIPMLVERPRARRHIFSAHLELLDVESESKIVTRTRDLTMFGFRAEIKDCSWPVGTRVRVKITHKASNFTAGARIVWVRKNTDLGVAFTDVTPRDQLILEKWIAGLRGSEVLAHSDSV
jgi:PilZ domain